MSRKYRRELLIAGYGRIHYKKIIPDVVSLCLLMYGLDDFTFSVTSSELTNIISKEILSTQFRQMRETENIGSSTQATFSNLGSTNTNNNNNSNNNNSNIIKKEQIEESCYKSDIFYCSNIKFQVLIKPDINTNVSNSTFSWGGNTNRQTSSLKLHINIIDDNPNVKQKIAKIVFLCTIYCKQTNIKIRTLITGTPAPSSITITRDVGFGRISLSLLEKFNEFSFVGRLDVLHIQKMDKTNQKLYIYHPNIQIRKKIKYKWKLNNNMIAYTTATNDNNNWYFSPLFSNNNWCLRFTFKDNKDISKRTFNVELMVLSLPINVNVIGISTKIDITYNNITHSVMKTREMSDNSSSGSWSWGGGNNQIYDGWNLLMFNINTDKHQINLDLITINICIEIYKASSKDYMKVIQSAKRQGQRQQQAMGNNNTNSTNTAREVALFKHLIPKEKFCLYGIRNQCKQILKENNHNIVNPFVLQKELSLNLDDHGSGDDEKDDEKELMNVDDESQSDNDSEQDNDLYENIIKNIKQIESKEKKLKKLNISKKVNEYLWIENTLKTLVIENEIINGIFTKFKQNKVTDKRLNDLDDEDWRELISQIGIRNEMKKLVCNNKQETVKTPTNEKALQPSNGMLYVFAFIFVAFCIFFFIALRYPVWL